MTAHDGEDTIFTAGIGRLVREAALTEYLLHTVLVELDGAEHAYAHEAGLTGTQFVNRCVKRIQQLDGARVNPAARDALLVDLEACKAAFEERHRFVHGTWTYDPETCQWWMVKGRRDGGKTPEVAPAGSASPQQLAAEFRRLNARLFWHLADRDDPWMVTKRV
ncbi:hypothetical protein [Streptomyces sp. NRRL S-1868]|uniref:hypothetical protein n=1 Tax=Streptomyces sp. NRRL S-1868 TaxID=1463892 RepID=UPI0004C49489|nr:hypothetical protein [Streptomyces sp. NRRL S-1868]